MACTNPPPLTEDEITAALDGEAELSVQQHLAHCSDCTARLTRARQLEQRLRIKLHRWNCPTPQELGDYYFKLSPREQDITEHLKSCVRCSDELAELQRFWETEAVKVLPTPQSKRTRAFLGEWVAQLLPKTSALAARGVDKGPLVAQAGDITIFLAVESTAQGILLTGQLAAPDQQVWFGAIVEIMQADTLQAAVVIDEWGSFRQDPFQPQPTNFRITSIGGQTILLKDVVFTDL
ncbi:MAG TPA: hypothetical protein VHP83_08415 [Aggregatilineaceae bacterium]|nr:hypothetical protein [Aggregatilineaceae bacterium]